MFNDSSGFLKANLEIVLMLIEREKNRDELKNKGIPEDQAELIAKPSKPAIAKLCKCSLSHTQNVHRVMKETKVLNTNLAR